MSLLHAPRAAKRNQGPAAESVDATGPDHGSHSIGDLIGEIRSLSSAQVEEILAHQNKHGVRFGEAAVELSLATRDEVLWALSRQFRYPYTAPTLSARSQPELVTATHPFDEQAEAFRELRSQLMMGLLAPDEPRRALAVVSPDAGDGKTFIAANLAVAFSQLGVHTLLIDMDMRTPRQHEVFGTENRSGVSNILSGRSESNIIRAVHDLPNLFVLPAGAVPPNPLELVQRPAFGLMVHELLTKFEYIVVDTPAAVRGADARVIAARCGAALAIGRRGWSRMRSMQKLVDALGNTTTRLAGVVINEH